MSQFTTSNETKFYQWVFENCNWKLNKYTQRGKVEHPFASYEIYITWMTRQK
jgi:hypothetical protein